MEALEQSPDAVVAYPRTARIEAGGGLSPRSWRLETAGNADPVERLKRSYDLLAAGDIVYGLIRSDALERCRVFPSVIAPDRLLLAELTLQGTFVQVPEVLWNRRRDVRFSLDRQRASLFGHTSPWHARLPWWIQHLSTFTRDVGVRDQAELGRAEAARASGVHASLAVRRALRRFLARAWTRTRLRGGATAGRWLHRVRDSD